MQELSNRKLNRKLRKAGLNVKVGNLKKQAGTSVKLRCELRELMHTAGGVAVDARKRYKGLSGGSVGMPASARGFYDGNKAKGVRKVTDRMDLAVMYQAKYSN